MDAKVGGREMRLYEEDGPLDKEIQDLERQAFQVQTLVPKFKRMVDQLDTSMDTREHRAQLSDTRSKIQNQAKEVKEKLMALNGKKDDLKQRQQDRLVRAGQNFAAMLEDFQQAMKRCMAQETAVAPHSPMSTSIPPSDLEAATEDEPLLRRQQQAQLESEEAHNEMIIEERDQEITNLVRDIGELNEMFQDVAVLVHDQGQMLDDIETNITRTADRVDAGNQELVMANRHQRSATSKRICCFVVLVAIIIVILIVVLVSLS